MRWLNGLMPGLEISPKENQKQVNLRSWSNESGFTNSQTIPSPRFSQQPPVKGPTWAWAYSKNTINKHWASLWGVGVAGVRCFLFAGALAP